MKRIREIDLLFFLPFFIEMESTGLQKQIDMSLI